MKSAVTCLSLAVLALCSTAWQSVGQTQVQKKVVQPPKRAVQPQKKPVPPGPKPKIVLSAESWDFGNVLYGDQPVQTFTIKNEGDADLVLDRVKGSCSCTVPSLKTKLLKPGESTEVTVNFNTKKRQGQISTLVQVRSNDPVHPILTYRVKGTVKRLINVEPNNVQLSGLKRDVVMSGTVKIVNQGEQPIKPSLKSINSDYFDVAIKEIEAGRVYELTVKTKPPIPYGTTRAGIELATGNTRQPTVRVPVNANVRARVSVNPPIIFVPKQSKSPSQRRIRVRYFGTDENFKVLSAVSSNAEKLPVEMLPAGAVNRPVVRRSTVITPKVERVVSVKVPPGAELVGDGYEIVIRTNDPEFEKIVIPVTGDPNVFRKSLGLRPAARPILRPAVTKSGAPGLKARPKTIKPAPKPGKKTDKP